ncbi:MAG: hypothetical protein ACM3NN_11655 [Nitrospirota bacterium]
MNEVVCTSSLRRLGALQSVLTYVIENCNGRVEYEQPPSTNTVISY